MEQQSSKSVLVITRKRSFFSMWVSFPHALLHNVYCSRMSLLSNQPKDALGDVIHICSSKIDNRFQRPIINPSPLIFLKSIHRDINHYAKALPGQNAYLSKFVHWANVTVIKEVVLASVSLNATSWPSPPPC